VKTKYSLILAKQLVVFNRRFLKKRNLFFEVGCRIWIFFICVLKWFFYKARGAKATAIYGDALKFGCGKLEVSEVDFINLFSLFFRIRTLVHIIPLENKKEVFKTLLEYELGVEQASKIHFFFTAHEILILQYYSQGESVLRKVAYGNSAQIYLQRHLASLIENRFIASIFSVGFKCPQLISESKENMGQVMLQSYVEGRIITPPYSSDHELLKFFRLAVSASFHINKAPLCQLGDWAAYRHFDMVSIHYNSQQKKLDFIACYIKKWLLGGSVEPVYIHGDFHFGNIIFNKDHCKVEGMIDFDRASPGGLCLHDPLNLMVSIFSHRVYEQKKNYGEVIKLILVGGGDPLLAECLTYLGNRTGYSQVDIKRMTLTLWLFYLQTAMSEGQQVGPVWHKKMLHGTVHEAYDFCKQHPLFET